MGYCTWADINEANRTYHDTEWGIPVHDDRHMFEHTCRWNACNVV